MRGAFFGVIFFAFSWAQADFLENAQVKFLCLAGQDKCRDFAKTPEPLRTAITSCELIAKSDFCQDLVKREPEFSGSLRRCKPADFCADHMTQEIDSVSACGQGFLEGTGEVFQGVIDTFANENQAIALCNTSIRCKRELVEGIPKFQNMSDESLHKFSAAALKVEMQNHVYIMTTQARQNVRWKSLSERAEEGERHSQLASRKAQAEKVFNASVVTAVKEWLEKKGLRLQCLDARTRAEMICWGLAYIVDPTIVAGAALKGARFAKYVSGGMGKVRESFEVQDKARKIESALREAMVPAGIDAKLLQTRVSSTWSNSALSAEEKIKNTYEQYISLRTTNLSPEKQKLAQQALASIKRPSNSSDAMYNPLKGEIVIGDKFSDEMVAYYGTAVHEFEHLAQLGKQDLKLKNKVAESMQQFFTRKKTSAPEKYAYLKNEFEAIGAQWDFMQSIPKEVRERAIANLRANKNFDKVTRDVLIADIQSAGLSREDFVKKVPPIHGYEVESSLVMDRNLRVLFIGTAALAAGTYAAD